MVNIRSPEKCTLTGELSGGRGLVGILSVPATREKDADVYGGDYEVVPDVYSAQTLETANKLLKEDIVVRAVPYSETGNSSDGITVYIGKEV